MSAKNVAANNILIALEGARFDLSELEAALDLLKPSGEAAVVAGQIRRQEAIIDGMKLAYECACAHDFEEDWSA